MSPERKMSLFPAVVSVHVPFFLCQLRSIVRISHVPEYGRTALLSLSMVGQPCRGRERDPFSQLCLPALPFIASQSFTDLEELFLTMMLAPPQTLTVMWPKRIPPALAPSNRPPVQKKVSSVGWRGEGVREWELSVWLS